MFQQAAHAVAQIFKQSVHVFFPQPEANVMTGSVLINTAASARCSLRPGVMFNRFNGFRVMRSVPPAVAGGCFVVSDPPATAGGTDLITHQ